MTEFNDTLHCKTRLLLAGCEVSSHVWMLGAFNSLFVLFRWGMMQKW